MGNASADNLIERILSEARESAERIRSDAQAAVESIARERDERIAKDAASFDKTRQAQIREILDGARTRAELDGRKELLAQKRAVLDRAFALAYEQLCSRSGSELTALYASILSKEAEDGSTVSPAKADREAVEQAIWQSGKELKLLDTDAPVERGFLLFAKSYEKDCSLKAILSELRDAEEPHVAEVLFS